jgi:dienelactone hydrolase
MQYRFFKDVTIPAADGLLKGELIIPADADAVIIFAHGSGSSRLSTRNQQVAQYLQQHGFGTLLFDLLTAHEDRLYQNRFNIHLLATRLVRTTRWLEKKSEAAGCSFGYFGASTGAAAALKAAAAIPKIGAVVSRGGRPDLAMESLSLVLAPTLLIVGGLDTDVILLNKQAMEKITCDKKMELVPGAHHLFEEPGKMEVVSTLACRWFQKYL